MLLPLRRACVCVRVCAEVCVCTGRGEQSGQRRKAGGGGEGVVWSVLPVLASECQDNFSFVCHYELFPFVGLGCILRGWNTHTRRARRSEGLGGSRSVEIKFADPHAIVRAVEVAEILWCCVVLLSTGPSPPLKNVSVQVVSTAVLVFERFAQAYCHPCESEAPRLRGGGRKSSETTVFGVPFSPAVEGGGRKLRGWAVAIYLLGPLLLLASLGNPSSSWLVVYWCGRVALVVSSFEKGGPPFLLCPFGWFRKSLAAQCGRSISKAIVLRPTTLLFWWHSQLAVPHCCVDFVFPPLVNQFFLSSRAISTAYSLAYYGGFPVWGWLVFECSSPQSAKKTSAFGLAQFSLLHLFFFRRSEKARGRKKQPERDVRVCGGGMAAWPVLSVLALGMPG